MLGCLHKHACRVQACQHWCGLHPIFTKSHTPPCRRDYILHYFDDLVATQGYSATVRE